jgi:DNA mismatch endonuclease, patch repair protein
MIKFNKIIKMKSKYGFITTKKRSNTMSKIKSKNTKPEQIIRKKLWWMGYRYRLNFIGLTGKPDLVFAKKKILVFIDGSFWHGYKWEDKKKKLKSNRKYWISKIEKNMKRDIKNNMILLDMGWRVFRFWDFEVTNESDIYIKDLIKELNKKCASRKKNQVRTMKT